ncbi:MAG TPA: bacteriohemerythrin, partial [bacterium]|nr:bacteriohemerythrin [bacterium]
ENVSRKLLWTVLQALFNKTDDLFDVFFEFIELKENEWNSIDGLEARPIFSPHPVETTIFVFRALSENGYKYYGHFADIIDLDILKNWITPSSENIGISEDLYNATKQEYLQKLDLKKIDIGGGLIHGNALNFKDDKSTKIILSHTALPLTDEQKEIGSGAVFGMTDILITSYRDYVLKNAYYSLKSYFPNIPQNQIEILLNNKIQLFRPEEIIIKNSEKSEYVYLILSGNVEGINANKKIKRILSAGAMIGLKSAVFNKCEMFTFRTKSYCNILTISIKLFNEFLKNNNLIDKFKELNDRRLFLESTWLFSNMVSYQLQNHIIFNMKLIEYPKNTIIENTIDGIYIINKGKIELSINDYTIEILNNYDFFNEVSILYNIYDIFKKKCLTNVSLYFLPKKYIKDIPSIYWRLEEIYNKRSRKIFNSEIINKNNFGWLQEYSINIKEIDKQHKKLFEITYKIIKSFDLFKDKNEIKKILDELLEYTHYHFKSEEEYIQNCGYSAIAQHINKHQYLIKELKKYYDYFLNNRHFSSNTFISFLKYWITEHILTEDKKLSFLCSS